MRSLKHSPFRSKTFNLTSGSRKANTTLAISPLRLRYHDHNSTCPTVCAQSEEPNLSNSGAHCRRSSPDPSELRVPILTALTPLTSSSGVTQAAFPNYLLSALFLAMHRSPPKRLFVLRLPPNPEHPKPHSYEFSEGGYFALLHALLHTLCSHAMVVLSCEYSVGRVPFH